MQGVQIGSLIRELRSHMPFDPPPKKSINLRPSAAKENKNPSKVTRAWDWFRNHLLFCARLGTIPISVGLAKFPGHGVQSFIP